MKLTIKELEKMLGVTPMTLYRWRMQEGMPYHKDESNGSVYFLKSEALEWVAANGKKVLLILEND